MLGIEDMNIVAGSNMSARFSESSNDSFLFGERYGEVDINDAQADNAAQVNGRINLAGLAELDLYWSENDEDDPELVLIENQRERNAESEYSAVRNFVTKSRCTSAYHCSFAC